MKKIVNTIILALLFGVCISHLQAQEKKEVKKVVVIEKVIDTDGNVTETTRELEGPEAQKYLEEVDVDDIKAIDIKKDDDERVDVMVRTKGNNIWISSDGEVRDLDGRNVKFLSKENYKIVTVDEKGNENTIEWDGEGSLEFEADEIPDDVRKILEEEGIDIMILNNGEGKAFIEVHTDEDIEKNHNKAQLGVIIKNADDGVAVNDVIEGSPAEQAGLVLGDIIQRINDTEIHNIESLVSAIGKYEVGDVITVHFLREGVSVSAEATLAKREEVFKHKSWESVIETHDDHKDEKKIRKKIKIKKED